MVIALQSVVGSKKSADRFDLINERWFSMRALRKKNVCRKHILTLVVSLIKLSRKNLKFFYQRSVQFRSVVLSKRMDFILLVPENLCGFSILR